MQIVTTTDQDECLAILDELELRDQFKPVPPHDTCDGVMELGPGYWLVGTNRNGHFTMHLLLDASAGAAWSFLDSLREPGNGFANPRAILPKRMTEAAHNN